MSEEQYSPVTPLDAAISQDSLQILKAAVPYMPGQARRLLSIYAKIMELSNTVALFNHPQPELSMMSSTVRSTQPADILSDIRQYAGGAARDNLDQLLFILNTIQLVQMYQEKPDSQEVE